jgi:hypothetical protein
MFKTIMILSFNLHYILVIFLYDIEYIVSDSMENCHLGQYFASPNYAFTHVLHSHPEQETTHGTQPWGSSLFVPHHPVWVSGLP